ncbi:unnamed protein product [Dracunculus medinensis]|uniref:Aquaporin-9 n=1 Tax=Dracunculus medinensis TaxID=318479 RepID=A0A0N4U315_DRAME|nr:unnamed protein product [Dracunculus medinensis]
MATVTRPEQFRKSFQIKNKVVRNTLAELAGTFLLLYIGESIEAQYFLSRQKMNTFMHINWGWCLNIIVVVQTVAKLSGGHLNPAISLMLFTFGEINVLELALYCTAQITGAFFGAAATYITYIDAINEFEGGPNLRTVVGPNSTAVVFATYPKLFVSISGALLNQIVSTGLLGFFVAVGIDDRNKIPKVARPAFFGIVVALIGHGFAWNCSYPINPARDFGPRLFTFFIYGSEVFTYPYSTWWLLPVIGPCIGAVLAGWFYHFAFGFHIPDEENTGQLKLKYIKNCGNDEKGEDYVKVIAANK